MRVAGRLKRRKEGDIRRKEICFLIRTRTHCLTLLFLFAWLCCSSLAFHRTSCHPWCGPFRIQFCAYRQSRRSTKLLPPSSVPGTSTARARIEVRRMRRGDEWWEGEKERVSPKKWLLLGHLAPDNVVETPRLSLFACLICCSLAFRYISTCSLS